jgi:16S rRNA processing protein RimM
MDYLIVGKFVNTHGIKGEIRVLSDFKYKGDVFGKGKIIYIGRNKNEYLINNYREHKNYDMLTLEGVNNINNIEMLKGSLVYIKRDDLEEGIILTEDLIDYKVYVGDKYIGNIIEILKGSANEVLVVSEKRILIPYVDEFITKISPTDREIYVKDVRGLMNED